MHFDLNWFFLLLSTTLLFIFQGLLVLSLLKKELKWKECLLFAFLNALTREGLLLVLPHYLSTLFFITYILIMIVSLKYVFKIGFFQSILATCLLIIFSGVIDYIVMSIFKISFPNRFDAIIWVNSFLHTIYLRLMAIFIWLIATAIVYFVNIDITIPAQENQKKYMSILVNSIITLLVIVPNILFLENSELQVPVEIFIYNSISLLVLLLLNIYNSVRSGELERKKEEVEFQKLYTQTLNDVIDGLRGFKHDYNNIIQVMGGYLSLNDMNGLKKFYSQMQNDCRTINNLLPLNSYVMDNPPLYGLLLSKISYSEVLDVKFTINITCAVDFKNVRVYDFCKVLGILLDNAFEAASKSEEKYVELFITKDKSGTLIFEISNSFFGQVDVHKIFENGFTTKEGHSGFGLWEVKKIISKYHNFSLKTLLNDSILKQKLHIGN